MRYEYSYEVRPGCRVMASGTIPQPTERDLLRILDTLDSLRDKPGFKFKVEV